MRCEILSWGKEVDCKANPEGNCADCDYAWSYYGLMGPLVGAIIVKVKDSRFLKDGSDLVQIAWFNDKKPGPYRWRISKGKFIADGKIQDIDK